jgi:hypothetical protein
VAGTCEYGNEPSGSINCGNFLTSCKLVSFSIRTLLHGVNKYANNLIPLSFQTGNSNDPSIMNHRNTRSCTGENHMLFISLLHVPDTLGLYRGVYTFMIELSKYT